MSNIKYAACCVFNIFELMVKSITERIISPVREFIQDSRAVGILLICCTVLSLTISNSGWGAGYVHFWERKLEMPIPELNLPHSILHFINDALMVFFFFLAGLEIKRELMVGELSTFRKSMLPVLAAVGGMMVPAFIYYLWCGNTPYRSGWGIPMATDIAFSLGILSLLGRKAPLSFRIFLTALAIIDDLGGILTIAIFYAKNINMAYLLAAALIVIVLAMMNVFRMRRRYPYYIFGALLWYLVFNSGIHATVAGVLLAFTIPLQRIEALEHSLHDPVNFIILPLFALANTAIILPTDFSVIFTSDVHHGILSGLALGKPIGIFLASFIAVKTGLGTLPNGMRFKHLIGVGMIAGIGFTMSIFIATLAFASSEMQTIAKVAIITASIIAALTGYTYLRIMNTIGRR